MQITTEISEIMAPVTAERCGGNPFYITAVVRQAAKQRKKISEEKSLNRIAPLTMGSELSSALRIQFNMSTD